MRLPLPEYLRCGTPLSLERLFDLHYVFTEEELEAPPQTVLGSVNRVEESRLGHPQERGIW